MVKKYFILFVSLLMLMTTFVSADIQLGLVSDITTGDIGINFGVDDSAYGEVFNMPVGIITIGSPGMYYNITNVTFQSNNNINFSNGKMTILRDGIYLVNAGISFNGQANTEYHLGLGVNGLRIDHCHATRKIGTGGDVGNVGFTCIDNFIAGDVITGMVENNENSANAEIFDYNLNMVKIGQ